MASNFQVKRIYIERTWKLLIIHSVQGEGSVLLRTNAEGILGFLSQRCIDAITNLNLQYLLRVFGILYNLAMLNIQYIINDYACKQFQHNRPDLMI